MKKTAIPLFSLLILSLSASVCLYDAVAFEKGNTRYDSFSQVKKLLERQIYYDHRITVYCGASFDEHKNIELPEGFETPKHKKRTQKIEWEHLVPAENFGRIFPEWREGNAQCIDNRGQSFKGRKCAEKTNQEYRLMHADMYNLYPAIGAVNALRSNYDLVPLGRNIPSTFGSCAMKIDDRKAEPPDRAKGVAARTHLYMEYAYPKFHLSRQQKRIMEIWDQQFPADQWECTRARRIERLQGNENPFVKKSCQQAGMW